MTAVVVCADEFDLVELVELNDEDLALVSGGVAVTVPAGVQTRGVFATGTGANVTLDPAGNFTAHAGTGGDAVGFVFTGPFTVVP